MRARSERPFRTRLMRATSSMAVATTALATLAACSQSSGSGATTTTATKNPAAAAAAIRTTKTYTDHPSAFPVSTPLPKALPPGTKFAYLQCSAPVCAELAVLMKSAVAAIHGTLTIVKGGASTQQLQSAFSSLLAGKPDALLVPGVEPDTIAPQLAQAKQEGIPMVSTGIMDIAKYGIGGSAMGQELAEEVGKLQADWVVANKGTKSNIVFYTTKELDFFKPEETSFRAELTKIGCACKVRTVNIPIATYGTTAPSRVISDLQANPNTTVAVFGANDPTTGLPAAMRSAGLSIPYIAYGPTPAALVDIKSGSQAAGLGLDYPAIAWTMVDQAARLLLKAPLTPAEQKSFVPVQWLSKDNTDFDISKPWTGYPDYADRFTKLWSVG
ncbi:substrate-binding domain-containing protein [Streptomyces sp. NPDC087856]|uniref:substrate-binding domain-containing protein n=1 Tax=Streptomyces sp. NPDC087856 TaxID=3365811 RepID=UPI0037F1140A